MNLSRHVGPTKALELLRAVKTNGGFGFETRVFNSILNGFAREKDYDGMSNLVSEMKQMGVKPDVFTSAFAVFAVVAMDFFKMKKFRKGARNSSKEKLNGDDTGIEGESGREMLRSEENATIDPISDNSNGTNGQEDEEEEDDDFITNEVKRRLKELRKNSFMVLIPEEENQEEEEEEEEEESSSSTVREWIDSDLGIDGFNNNWLCGFDSFYDKYCERMLFFDKIIAKLFKEPGMLDFSQKSPKSSKKLAFSTLKSLSFKLQSTNQNQAESDSQQLSQPDPFDPFETLETAYVAQLALSWEALHCQFTQLTLKISSNTENNMNFIRAAQSFQQFMVLLVRFVETEPFETGSRVEIYARSRAHLSKLLQVPNFQERAGQSQSQSQSQTQNETETIIPASDLMKVLEESILTFRLFLKKDKKKSGAILGVNSINGSSLQQVQASLEKKEMRVKELLKKKKGWKCKMWPNSSEEIELLFALIDIKVVSRVLRMQKLSKEQLLWCEEKMSKIDLSCDNNKQIQLNLPKNEEILKFLLKEEMGCSASRLEDEEAVQLCKDRTNFIKQALEERSKFSSGHFAYIQSLKRVSMALNRFINGDFKQDLLLPFDPCITPPKIKQSDEFFTIDPQKRTVHVARNLKSGQNASISVQERPQAETVQIESHYQMEKNNNNNEESSNSNGLLLNEEISTKDPPKREFHVSRYLRSGSDASISVQERPSESIRIESYYPNDSSNYSYNYFDSSSYANMPSSSYNYDDNNNNYAQNNTNNNYPPNSPQNWDSFWNPFSSLDNNNHVYPNPSSYNNYSNNNYDRVIISDDDDVAGLKRVREQEGIPDLEDDINSVELELKSENDNSDSEEETEEEIIVEEIIVEKEEQKQENKREERETKQEIKGLQNRGTESVKTEEREKKELVRENGGGERKPEFRVYVDRRPVSLGEVMREIEVQFERIADVASEVSGLLEAGRVQFNQLGSSPSDLAARMLNPATLFRTGSSRSLGSSRFFLGSTSFRDDASSCFSDDSSVISDSHHSTLDRLYMWEKKLYREVKAGEKIRIEYEKKLNQLKNQDYTGAEPGSLEKTRDALMNLRTRLKVSIHSVQSISKRIEALRDDELYPQLMDLIQGLEKMWRAMSDCHYVQKYAIHEAKPLIFSTKVPILSSLDPATSSMRGPHSVLGPMLESELKNWRQAFWAWISAQKAYALALSGWAQRCCGAKVTEEPDELKRDTCRVFATCSRWARLMESVSGAQVMDGLDFFSAGVGSVCARPSTGSNIGTEMGEDEVAEMEVRVVFAGLSVAVSALADFAGDSAEKYERVVKRCKECEKDGGGKV
ncbi:hypothetical protein LUZ60_002568 [Juncus effusus]|nr:hypothetical protein LUZ60_002568 [Juncus effusus]